MDTNKIRYFFPKVRNRIDFEKNRLWKYFDVERKSLQGYRPFEDAAIFKTRLQTLLGVYNAEILLGVSDEDKKVILNSADQALIHEFDLLGSDTVKLNPIDWHLDLKNGARWQKGFYKEIQTPKGADIKMPWELSRCQHLLWLGEAWLLTKEQKYAKEIIDEICWWIEDNPLMYTVNWKCAMDVAFRAVNWMFALNLIVGFEGFDNSFVLKVSRSLWQHGFFIRNNLEKVIPNSNNHYASDLVGLLYLGELFGESRKGNSWLRFSMKEFYRETLHQVFPSGVHYERSVSYHRMMTEMLSYPIYMLNRMNENVPLEVMERIGNMYSYIAAYTKPNNLSPLIADNDNGRFVPFLSRDFRKHGYLNDANSIENRFISVGLQPQFCKSNRESEFYQDAGMAIIRKKDDYLIINNGGYSCCPNEAETIVVTHTHNDFLSFELTLGGKDILVDAGTYLYTSSDADRNAFRSATKHNTIVVDGEEQNSFASAFSLRRNIKSGRFQQLKDGSIVGDYTTIKGRMHHQRQFVFDDDRLVLIDDLTKTGDGHKAKLYLHFAECIEPSIEGNVLILNSGLIIDFDITPSCLEVIDDAISPSYGILVKTKTAIAEFEFNDKLCVKTIIYKHGCE